MEEAKKIFPRIFIALSIICRTSHIKDCYKNHSHLTILFTFAYFLYFQHLFIKNGRGHTLSLYFQHIFFGGGDVFDIAHFLPRTEFFENDGKYFLVFALATIATLSFQHKAVFTKKTDDDKVHFWKQITPYFIYGRREFDVKDLSYWVKKRKKRHYHDDHHLGIGAIPVQLQLTLYSCTKARRNFSLFAQS